MIGVMVLTMMLVAAMVLFACFTGKREQPSNEETSTQEAVLMHSLYEMRRRQISSMQDERATRIRAFLVR